MGKKPIPEAIGRDRLLQKLKVIHTNVENGRGSIQFVLQELHFTPDIQELLITAYKNLREAKKDLEELIKEL